MSSLRRDSPALRWWISCRCSLQQELMAGEGRTIAYGANESLRAVVELHTGGEPVSVRSRSVEKSLSGRSAFAPVMQPAHFGDRDDEASIRRLYTPWVRGVLLQCEVRASALVVRDERLKMPAQAGLVEHNYVIKAFAADGANDSFDIGALPRRVWCRQIPV